MSFKNFNSFMERYASEIGGQFSEYDRSKSVIIVPIDDNRFQAVTGVMKLNSKYNKTGIEFSSRVCAYHDDINMKELLEENYKLCYAKFVLAEDFIKVEASTFADYTNEELLKEMVMEVANTADEWELRMTGSDVH